MFTTAAGVPGLGEVQYRGYSSQRSRIELRVLDDKPNSQTLCDDGEEYAYIDRIRLFRFGCSYTHCINNFLCDIDKTANVVIRKCVVSYVTL